MGGVSFVFQRKSINLEAPPIYTNRRDYQEELKQHRKNKKMHKKHFTKVISLKESISWVNNLKRNNYPTTLHNPELNNELGSSEIMKHDKDEVLQAPHPLRLPSYMHPNPQPIHTAPWDKRCTCHSFIQANK